MENFSFVAVDGDRAKFIVDCFADPNRNPEGIRVEITTGEPKEGGEKEAGGESLTKAEGKDAGKMTSKCWNTNRGRIKKRRQETVSTRSVHAETVDSMILTKDLAVSQEKAAVQMAKAIAARLQRRKRNRLRTTVRRGKTEGDIVIDTQDKNKQRRGLPRRCFLFDYMT